MNGGGAQRAVLALASGIATRGFAVDLVLARAEGPYMAQVPESVRVVNLNASRVLSSLPGLVRYLRGERPQSMLSAMNYVNIVALWARSMAATAIKVVVSEHSTVSSEARHASSRRGRLMPLLVKNFYPWADVIVAVSEGVADDLARAVGRIQRERIQVIYNPVVSPELRANARAPIDHPWFEPGQPPVLLATGRLTAQKDFPTLIESFSQVRQVRPVRLLILGEGEERPALEGLVSRLCLETDVDLPGFVENPYAYMSRASLFILSSRWEALPTVLIEALYCGVPLIATDCPNGPQEILADGQYGQLVPVGDVAALAQAIHKGLADNRRSPPSESWRPFETKSVVNQYLNVLLGN